MEDCMSHEKHIQYHPVSIRRLQVMFYFCAEWWIRRIVPVTADHHFDVSLQFSFTIALALKTSTSVPLMILNSTLQCGVS